MRFQLYATFRLLAGVKSGTIDLPDGATVREAVDAIIAAHPSLRSHWLNAGGELHAHVHIFVNGNDVLTLAEGLQTPLDADASLDFFPPVGGGA